MDRLFEYEYTENEGYVRSYLKFILLRRPEMIVLRAAMAVIGLIALIFAIVFTARGVDSSTLWILFAFSVIYQGLTVLMYFYTVSASKKRVKELYGGEYPIDRAYFTETELHYENGGQQAIHTQLSSVKALYETDTLILLKTGARVMHVFSKDGFTKGTPEELKSFFRAKGVKMKF